MRKPRGAEYMLTLRIWLVAFDSSYSTYVRFHKTNADLGDQQHWGFPNQEEEVFEDEKIP